MSTSAQLYQEAIGRAARAERCCAVADEIDFRRGLLTERTRAAVARHTDQVWQSRAATASRRTLNGRVVPSLYFLALDLAATSRALREEAAGLNREAWALRRQAEAGVEKAT